jgi:hypothetical protein
MVVTGQGDGPACLFLFLQNACVGLGLWDILGGLSVVAMAWQSIQPSVDLDA